jgi:hypothetical protein
MFDRRCPNPIRRERGTLVNELNEKFHFWELAFFE